VGILERCGGNCEASRSGEKDYLVPGSGSGSGTGGLGNPRAFASRLSLMVFGERSG
jgi:hypothetical protein